MSLHPPNHEHTDEQMLKVEVNLDDTPGEWLGYVMDQLFEMGANDVYYTPIYMKKNRPAVQLQVLCKKNILENIKQIILTETTTLGIRYYPLTVYRMERQMRTIDTKWGKVTIKEGIWEGKVIQASPEYEDCSKLAELHQVPLKDIYAAVWQQLK